MIDIEYEINPDHWGVIEEIGEDYVTIFREQWAPGLWAGVKNQSVIIKERSGSFYKCCIGISHVDLEERKLFFVCGINGHNMTEGDTIHYMRKV